MTTCILHVGMHKTGTSSIQTSLAGLPDNQQFKYANFGHPNASATILAAFQKRGKPHRAGDVAPKVLESRQTRARARFASVLDTLKDRDIIISGEGMMHLKDDEFDALLLAIPHSDIRVVGYVRSPRSYLSSACQERIKGGMHNLETVGLFPNYRVLFEKFINRLPTALYHFDKERLQNGCVVQDFCSHIDHAIPPEDVVNTNESLSRQAIKLLYCWNIWRHAQGIPDFKHWVLPPVLVGLKDVPFRLADSFTEGVIKRNAKTIAWIEQHLGSPFRVETSAAGAGMVRTVDELTKPNDVTINWLCARIDKRSEPAMAQEKIAIYMQLLYEKSLLQSNGKVP